MKRAAVSIAVGLPDMLDREFKSSPISKMICVFDNRREEVSVEYFESCNLQNLKNEVCKYIDKVFEDYENKKPNV